MSDYWLLLIMGLPLAGAALSLLPWWVSRRDAISPYLRFWLDALALALICAGIVGAGVLALFTPDGTTTTLLGVELMISPVARVVLSAVCGALALAVLFSWDDSGSQEEVIQPYHLAWGAASVGAMLAVAMLATSRVTQGILLLGVALAVAAVSLGRPARMPAPDSEFKVQGSRLKVQDRLAARLTGGLKHLAIAGTGTALLVLGVLALAQYSLNLEDRSLLQLGVGMLSVGLMVRVGAMPFAAAYSDMARAAPGLAILALGAAAPGVLVVGLLMLAPVESGLVSAQSAGWLGAVATFVAGLRAIGAGSRFKVQGSRFKVQGSRFKVQEPETLNPVEASGEPDGVAGGEEEDEARVSLFATLATATIATQIGWALVGVLSGTQLGVIGALLLVVNMTMAVPLLIACGDRRVGRLAGIGRAVGVASLVGLPPLGGAVGTLMVAQAAANHSGWWLALLLLGTLMTGAGWLMSSGEWRVGSGEWGAAGERRWGVAWLMVLALMAAQVVLFLASARLEQVLFSWSGVPWLGGP